MLIYLEKNIHSSQSDTESKTYAGSLSSGLQLPIHRYCLCGHRATCEVLQELIPSHSFSIFKNHPALVSTFSIIMWTCNHTDGWLLRQKQTSKNQCGKEELGGTKATPQTGNTDGCTQHSLLSVGLNLSRLTDQWMQTADQTTQRSKTHIGHQCVPTTALDEIPTH